MEVWIPVKGVEKHYTYLPLPQIVMKNRTNHLLFNAQWVLCKF